MAVFRMRKVFGQPAFKQKCMNDLMTHNFFLIDAKVF